MERRSGVRVMVNSRCGSELVVLSTHCSPDLELLTVKVRPFYLPRVFSSAVITIITTGSTRCAVRVLRRRGEETLLRFGDRIGAVLEGLGAQWGAPGFSAAVPPEQSPHTKHFMVHHVGKKVNNV